MWHVSLSISKTFLKIYSFRGGHLDLAANFGLIRGPPCESRVQEGKEGEALNSRGALVGWPWAQQQRDGGRGSEAGGPAGD